LSLPEWTLSFRFDGKPNFSTAKAMTARSALNSFFELCQVADVINALVESPGEFRRDGLDGNPLVSKGGENYQ